MKVTEEREKTLLVQGFPGSGFKVVVSRLILGVLHMRIRGTGRTVSSA